MATLLLTEQPGGSYVTLQQSQRWLRLLVQLRAAALDTALAAGADPDSSAALSLRAHQLIGCNVRRRLAREIRTLLIRAERPLHPMRSTVPICRHKVIEARQALHELAHLKVSPGPVDARGVARLRRLLRDGEGPIFRRPRDEDLEPELEAIIEALVVRC
jgi:hypothetical protein